MFIPEYVVGHWWGADPAQPVRTASQGQVVVRTECDGDLGAVALRSSDRLKDAPNYVAPGRPPGRGVPIAGSTRAHGNCAARSPAWPMAVPAWPRRRARRLRHRGAARRDGAGADHRYLACVVLAGSHGGGGFLSPDRTPVSCPAAAAGAGCCDLAFGTADAIRAAKTTILADALTRIGASSRPRGSSSRRCPASRDTGGASAPPGRRRRSGGRIPRGPQQRDRGAALQCPWGLCSPTLSRHRRPLTWSRVQDSTTSTTTSVASIRRDRREADTDRRPRRRSG